MTDYIADWDGRLIHRPAPSLAEANAKVDGLLRSIACRVVKAHEMDGGLNDADLAYLAPLASQASAALDAQSRALDGAA
jgi:hypothetical protein